METNKFRNSNIELLRIICLIFIILHHSFCHSNIQITKLNINYGLLYFLQYFGRVANNIFVIITGYYMVNKKTNKKTITKLICETIFYSYIILFIYLLFAHEKNIELILKSIIPILSNSNWFVTSYLLLYISIPYINILIKNISKKEHFLLISFMLLCFSILPTISLLEQYFSCYIWFICLYLVGSYLQLYRNEENFSKSKYILIFSIVSLIVEIAFEYYFHTNIHYIGEVNNFIIFTLAIGIFIEFAYKEGFYNKYINYVASSVLGIYLIHDNFILSPIIWQKANLRSYISSPCFWMYEILVIIIIFVVCLIIDKIRQICIEKTIFKFVDKKIQKIKTKNIEQ